MILSKEEFAEQHYHMYYCETIIYPNGYLEYAIPSHQEKLLKVYMKINNLKTRQEAWDSIPPADYCIEWMCEQTKCVTTHYSQCMGYPNESQMETIKYLNELKITNIRV